MLTVPPLEPGCPWYEISLHSPPNIKWCEASLCSWITEPANTWSNLAYVIAGFFILNLYKKHGGKSLKRAGWYSIWIGILSAIYHASYNFYAQVLDFFAMYLMGFFTINLCLIRLGWMKKENEIRWYWGSVFCGTLLTIIFKWLGIPYQGIVLVIIIAALMLEIINWNKASRRYSMKLYIISQALMLLGAIFSALDAKRIFCDPNNHWIQGHALWHIIVAIAFAVWALHIKQFIGKSID